MKLPTQLSRVLTGPPRGLVSPKLLAARLTPELRAHRTLLLRSFGDRSRPVALGLVLASWLHWLAFGARRELNKTIDRHGDAVARHHGIAISTQRRCVRRLALVHCIPPSDAYDLELFLPAQRADVWHNVFTPEIGAFHPWRSERHGSTAQDVAAQSTLLSDKRATCTALEDLGIAVPRQAQRLSTGATRVDLGLGERAVFCRPNVGNAARGAFSARIRVGALHVEPVVGRTPENAEEYLERVLQRGDLLVEELVLPHPDFVERGMPDDLAVVVRIVTEGGRAVCAFAELPLRVERDGRTLNAFAAFEIDLDTGLLGRRVDPDWHGPADEAVRRDLSALREAAAAMEVPYFAAAVDAVERSCAICPSIYGVAWDVAIGPTGPVVLEGNTGWSIRGPQRLLGPMVSRELQDESS